MSCNHKIAHPPKKKRRLLHFCIRSICVFVEKFGNKGLYPAGRSACPMCKNAEECKKKRFDDVQLILDEYRIDRLIG